jgi:uncharacterized membrane protein
VALAATGIVLSFLAMEGGDVSLVSAVLGSRPLFVFIFALILSRISPHVLIERFTPRTVFTKVIAITMIVTGITLINMK